MKKRNILVYSLFTILFLSFVSASCDLDVSLINQDPYPALPGDYVKLVFQITGTQSSECRNIYFELQPKYPIIFDPNETSKIKIKGGIFLQDFSSNILVPYKVRVDKDALDGDNPIEVRFSTDESDLTLSSVEKEFNLVVEDPKTDFEVFIKDYDFNTRIMTLEILNIGEADIEALTIEIPNQDNVQIKGAYRNIVGDLDSNDFTTAEFEAIPSEGELSLTLHYTDSINVRRSISKTVTFDPEYFQGRKQDENGTSISTYFIIILIVLGVIYWIYRGHKRKKKQKHRMHHNS
jgi:hypothetical protein